MWGPPTAVNICERPSLPRAASFKRAELKPVSPLDPRPSPAPGNMGHVESADEANEEVNSKTNNSQYVQVLF